MANLLDEQVIAELLKEADDLWHNQHSGEYKYGEHITFQAEYVAGRYNKRLQKKLKRKEKELACASKGSQLL